MRKISIWVLPILLSTPVSGQAVTGTITHNNVSFTVASIPGSTNTAGPSCNFSAAGVDHLFQSGWLYRIDADPNGSGFNNSGGQMTTSYAGRAAQLNWANADGRGISAQLDIHVLSTGATTGICVQKMTVTNRTAAAMTVNLYAYADFDVSGTFGNDSAVLVTPAPQQQITDPTTGVRCYFLGIGEDNYQTAVYNTVATAILGGAINLSNTGLPFGPGDWTSAYQWRDRVLQPNEDLIATVVLGIERQTPCEDDNMVRFHGPGKPGTNGNAAQESESLALGQANELTFGNGPVGAVPIILLGFGAASIPVPPFGNLYMATIATNFLGPPFDATRTSTAFLTVPDNPAFCGIEVEAQAVWGDPGASAGLQHSGGASLPVSALGLHHMNKAMTGCTATIKVGETLWISLGRTQNCTGAVSRNAAIATAGANNGPFRGGFDVTGVAPGFVVVDYTGIGGLVGMCFLTVVP
jgi:cellobiose-specific phosphotransferase system component IIB